MGKNNRLINQFKQMHQSIQNLTPEIYAGIALALHRRFGWGFKRINDLFLESQDIWNECVRTGKNIQQMCLDETGIDVVRKVNDKNG